MRAADSIGANIAEGAGRGSFQDNRRCVRIARGSLNETKHWLRRAYSRKLLVDADIDRLKPLVDELAPRLNAYLRSIGPVPSRQQPADHEQSSIDNRQLTTDNGPRTMDTKENSCG